MALTGGDPADKEEEETTTPPAEVNPQSTSVSLVNVVLLYLILMGVGTLGGFGMFYFVYMGRCTEVLKEVQSASEQQWQNKYEREWEEKQLCLADTSAKEELYKLQGRLAAKDALSEQREALFKAQEEGLKQVGVLQDTIRALRGELSEKEQDGRSIQEVMNNMDKQLSLYRNQVGECTQRLPNLTDDVRRMRRYLVERNLKMCQMDFGKGPFFIEFTVMMPSNGEPHASSFEVQVSPVADLPHTIVTFLTLVDTQLYDGTRFTLADDRQLQGGTPHFAVTDQQATKLLDRYRKFGLNAEAPLAFPERSPKIPLTQYTFGFAGASPYAGPAFAINMADNTKSQSAAEACFGKVTRGFETLQQIQALRSNQTGQSELVKIVEIVSVRLNRAPRKQTAARKE